MLFQVFGQHDSKSTLFYEQNPKTSVSKEKNIPSVPTDGSEVLLRPTQLMSKLFSANNGIFIGDMHGDLNCSEFVATSTPFFKKQGVEVIFMEMFKSADQPMLDSFFEKGSNKQELIDYLKNGWDKSPGSVEAYVEIVALARENGIRTVGIDIKHTGQSRLETSNPAWERTITSYLDSHPDAKYVVFGGRGHSAVYPANRGIDAHLGIPAIDLETGTPGVLKGNGKDNDFIIKLKAHPNQAPSLF